jgi:hypothetical protein
MRKTLFALALFALGTNALAQSSLFITTTDFASGSAAFVPAGADQAEANLLNLHSDAVVRYYQGRIYIVNRLGQDNVLILDESDPRTPVLQFSTGNGTNPHDIEFASPTKAYISRYDDTQVLIVNPQDGSELGTIDLGAFADSDGLPEMSQMALVGNRLYIACQVQDRDNGFAPAPQGLLVVVDIATDQLVDMDPAQDGIQAWSLTGGNPTSVIAAGNSLVIAEISGFGDTAGGIEVLDLASETSRGLVVSEVNLGGDINSLTLADAGRGYAVVTDANFANFVRPFDLGTGQVSAPLENHSTGFTPSLAVDGNRLYVADRGTFSDPDAGGLLIYDTATNQLVAGPIATGLPPNDIAVLSDAPIPTAVEEETGQTLPEQSDLGLAYPNPFNAETLIPFQVSDANAPIELAIYDLLGRRVRTLFAGILPTGEHRHTWDGRNDNGALTGSGAYFIELRQGKRRQARKVTLLK